ncbi:MAG: hypothetical protein PW792_03690 [Acidobacteriaceae bacterium]|nr:hypothetical protein [Acidobacteriaceae bacterium]
MSLRPRHLACLLLLLSSLASASAQPARENIFTGRYIDVLLLRHAAEAARAAARANANEHPEPARPEATQPLQLSAEAQAQRTLVWAPPAPVAQTASIHARTATPATRL